MRKNNKNNFILLLLILLITIGFATLSTTLNINGTTKIKGNTWDVHFTNVVVKDGSVDVDTPTITNKTTLNFEVELDKPGDFYEFTVDVVNAGSIDAMIENVVKTPELTAEQAKFLKYEISYQNGESITTKQLLAKETTMPIKVRVEYRNDLVASDLPTGQVQLTLGLVLDYIQSDGTGTTVTNNGVLKPVANGSLDAIGTVVTIGSEQFYTIGTEGDNVKLLSMYNLNVGNKVTAFDLYNFDVNVVPITNPTGLQSSDAIGARYDENEMPAHLPWIGTVAFATKDKHGTNYSDYSGSLIETYVNNYEVAIEAMGVNVESARLITKEELIGLGCNHSEYTCIGTDYPWIYSTFYWSGSAHDPDYVWIVDCDGDFGPDNSRNDDEVGARPVIIISKSNF